MLYTTAVRGAQVQTLPYMALADISSKTLVEMSVDKMVHVLSHELHANADSTFLA